MYHYRRPLVLRRRRKENTYGKERKRKRSEKRDNATNRIGHVTTDLQYPHLKEMSKD